ncbi:hypothetical protein FSP39_004367 [Pinctada imbricata]|uniref:Uncharacterized protein n=1 Tax=Pinctada imbricata TaxID=66713 RepID=A0AA88XEM7_PINIB|nr:hypothetical protein FSP39_004367 [Pinctada imbricata]
MAAASAGQLISATPENQTIEITDDLNGTKSVASVEALDAEGAHTQGLLGDRLLNDYQPIHTDIGNAFTNGVVNGVEFQVEGDTSFDVSIANTPLAQSTQNTQDISLLLQQNEVQLLDNELRNLPKKLYIEKIVHLVNNNEQIIMWYRNILCSRARALHGCPQGNLITRKTTKSRSCVVKYAEDCHILCMFLQGVKNNIDELFDKSRNNVVFDIPRSDLVEIRSTVQALVHRTSMLEQDRAKQDRALTSLMSEMKLLKEKNDLLSTQLHHLRESENSLRSDIEEKMKKIGSVDASSVDPTKTLAGEVNRLSKVCINLQSQINDVPRSQSFASVTCTSTPSRAHIPLGNGAVNVSNRDEVTEASSILTKSFITVDRPSDRDHASDNSVFEIPNHGDQQRSPISNTANSKQRQNVSLVQVPEVETTADAGNEDFFRGVHTYRKVRFHLSKIDRRSSKDAILNYVERKGVKVTHIRMFTPRSERSQLTAKINVLIEHAQIVESRNFWPKGVKCRRWLSRRQWDRARGEQDDFRDGFEDDENWGDYDDVDD